MASGVIVSSGVIFIGRCEMSRRKGVVSDKETAGDGTHKKGHALNNNSERYPLRKRLKNENSGQG